MHFSLRIHYFNFELQSEEINRRFDAMARGEVMSPLTLKRRKGPPVTLGGLKPLSDVSVWLSLDLL